MIDSVGVNRTFDFDTRNVSSSKNIVCPARNTSGLYGLYENGVEIIPYQFKSLRKAQATANIIKGSNEFDFFEASVDSGPAFL